jgi:hypothetical protein
MSRWEDNIKWILEKCRYCIHHIQDRKGWGLFVNTVIIFEFRKMRGIS